MIGNSKKFSKIYDRAASIQPYTHENPFSSEDQELLLEYIRRDERENGYRRRMSRWRAWNRFRGNPGW